MGMRAHEADEGAVDRAAVGDREQVVEEPPAERAVVERDRGGGQLADEDGPQVGAVGAPVPQREDGVELAAGDVEVAGAGMEPGGDGVRVRGGADPPAVSSTAAAKWKASSAANTWPPRSWRRSNAAATRWCRSSRRAGGKVV
ncbi:hypothetical protein [Acrocarpospora sp. B8E8]|uniref:hypothetical protein n=1 Tax=Acrocarpospora sp. B8E8 TaxID=3153572 RepID=UPI00325D5631